MFAFEAKASILIPRFSSFSVPLPSAGLQISFSRTVPLWAGVYRSVWLERVIFGYPILVFVLHSDPFSLWHSSGDTPGWRFHQVHSDTVTLHARFLLLTVRFF
jgi:hypothetical protein